MGKFEKYKKDSTGPSKLEKYKKSHGSTLKTAEKKSISTLKQRTRPLKKKKKAEGDSTLPGTILIIVLGAITVGVWVGVLVKLFSS
ncbi:hypothetical protein KAU33_06790 [Candidatus Dependentiae bacterium]|nr:hypothetical protein [Candidatus Dependentiae bacterium]